MVKWMLCEFARSDIQAVMQMNMWDNSFNFSFYCPKDRRFYTFSENTLFFALVIIYLTARRYKKCSLKIGKMPNQRTIDLLHNAPDDTTYNFSSSTLVLLPSSVEQLKDRMSNWIYRYFVILMALWNAIQRFMRTINHEKFLTTAFLLQYFLSTRWNKMPKTKSYPLVLAEPLIRLRN